MKILFYGDMLCRSGFAKVSHNIIKQLEKDGHEFIGIGINYRGEPAQLTFPELAHIPVFPCGPDDFLGKKRLLAVLNDKTIKFDVLFILGDLFNMLDLVEPIKKARKERKFKVVLYFPVDCSIKESWKPVIRMADKAITYTKFAQNECHKFGVCVDYIYHGTDTNIFKPGDKKLARKRLFSFLKDDDILLTNVNTNQPRKDPTTSIDAFAEFYKNHNNAYLYMHCLPQASSGYDLIDYIHTYHPNIESRIIFPDLIHDNYTEEMMALIYQCSDIVFTTSLGEGWGLSITEALACNIITVVPYHTSLKEISDNYGGISGEPNKIVINTRDNSWRRPGITGELMHDGLELAYRKLNSIKIKTPPSWDEVGKQWREVINNL